MKMMEELAIAEGRLPGDIKVRATGTHGGSTWGDITASSGSNGGNGGSGNNIPGNTSRGSLLGDGDEPAAIGHNQPPETVTPSKQESSRNLENDNNTEISNPDPTDADRDLLSASLEDMYPPGTLSAAKIWKAKNSGQSGWPTTPGQNSLCSALEMRSKKSVTYRTKKRISGPFWQRVGKRPFKDQRPTPRMGCTPVEKKTIKDAENARVVNPREFEDEYGKD